MIIQFIKASFSEALKKAIRNSGFSLKFSNVKNRSKNPIIRIFAGAGLYILFLAKKAYLLITGKFELDYAEVFITSRCNLRCRDCSVMIPYLPRLEDYDVKEAISDIKSLLEVVDCIHKVGILGGEAMLNADIILMLEFLQDNSKVKSIRVVTNGLYMPDDNILDALQKAKKVHVDISKYNMRDGKGIEELSAELRKRKIEYSIYEDMSWNELGRPDMKKTENLDEINRRFKYCWMKRCNGILHGKYHVCSRSIFLPLVRDIGQAEKDYIDLRKIDNIKDARKALKKLYKRKSISACAYCNGTFDSPFVDAAVQINR